MRGAFRHLLLALLFAVSVVSSHAAAAGSWSPAPGSGGEPPSLELGLALADAALPASRLELPAQTAWRPGPQAQVALEPQARDDARRDALERQTRDRPRRVFTRLRIPRMHSGDDRPPRARLND